MCWWLEVGSIVPEGENEQYNIIPNNFSQLLYYVVQTKVVSGTNFSQPLRTNLSTTGTKIQKYSLCFCRSLFKFPQIDSFF
jgi:hypothetical protein